MLLTLNIKLNHFYSNDCLLIANDLFILLDLVETGRYDKHAEVSSMLTVHTIVVINITLGVF